MWLVRCLPVLGFVIVATVPMASANDELYRCADGTFTNRAERQCPPYESTGVVRVQKQPEDSKSTLKSDEPKQPFAEVKAYNEGAKTQTEGR
jgi:hypothetical protein